MRNDRYQTRVYKGGMVRVWSVLTGTWWKMKASDVGRGMLATLPERDRQRIIKAAGECT